MSLKLECFSKTGKLLAENINIKSERTKRQLGKDLFTPDKNWLKNNYLCDNAQIEKECNLKFDEIKRYIKLNISKKKEKEKKKGQKELEENDDLIFKKIFQGIKYKYHNMHISKILKFRKKGIFSKFDDQHKTLYHPKYEYIFQKINTGPIWSNLTYRQKNLFKEQNYITNLSYNDSLFYKDNIKGFVDMSKQTQRKGIIKELEKKVKINYSSPSKTNKKNHFILLNPKKTEETVMTGENRSDYNKKNKSGPDFNRYLSRDHLNNIFKKNERIINGELSPNYNSVESSNKMMVNYKKSRNRKLRDNRTLNSFSFNIIFDANKAFDKLYGNKYKVVPNFEKMIPRKNDELPFFFHGLTNRNIYSMNTEKSMKMNYYSNSKLYNLCGNMKKITKKYRNKNLANVRKYFSFDNEKNFQKNRILNELKEKIKKFNRLVMNKEINYADNL